MSEKLSGFCQHFYIIGDFIFFLWSCIQIEFSRPKPATRMCRVGPSKSQGSGRVGLPAPPSRLSDLKELWISCCFERYENFKKNIGTRPGVSEHCQPLKMLFRRSTEAVVVDSWPVPQLPTPESVLSRLSCLTVAAAATAAAPSWWGAAGAGLRGTPPRPGTK